MSAKKSRQEILWNKTRRPGRISNSGNHSNSISLASSSVYWQRMRFDFVQWEVAYTCADLKIAPSRATNRKAANHLRLSIFDCVAASWTSRKLLSRILIDHVWNRHWLASDTFSMSHLLTQSSHRPGRMAAHFTRVAHSEQHKRH